MDFRRSKVSLGLIVAAALTACAPGPAAGPVSPSAVGTGATSSVAPPVARVTIIQGVDSLNHGPIYLARARYFKEEGIESEHVLVPSGFAALLSGEAQFALNLLSTGLQAVEQGQPLVALTANSSEYGNEVVMRTDVAQRLGITYASSEEAKVRALKGLKIGITVAGGGADQLARYLLRKYGFDPDRDIELVAAKDNLAAMAAKQLDAFVFPLPESHVAVARGDAIWLFKTSAGDIKDISPMTYGVLWARRDYVEKNPDVVKRVVRAIVKGSQLIKQKPDEAKSLVKTFFKDLDDGTFNAAWQIKLPAYADPEITQAGFDSILKFQQAVGKPIKATFAQVVDPSFVRAAKSDLGVK